MNRTEFRAAFRMARLVRQFCTDVGISTSNSSLASAVPLPAFFAACRYGDSLTHGRAWMAPGSKQRREISGPRGVLPA